MGVKILHSADWHLDTPFGGFSPEQREYLRQKMASIPQKIAETVRREDCDLVLLAGDLFDGIPSRDTVENVKAALAECGVPVFISPGNHDPLGPGSPWLEEAWPENVHIFTGGLESLAIPELNCRVWGAGYRSMDCPALLEGFRAEGTETYQIGILHGDPTTANSPNCPVTAAQVRQSDLTYLALGHIHKAGSFQAGETLCGWPGCPMGRGWDELGDKGVYLVTLAEEANIRPISLDLPRFFRLEGEWDALEAMVPGAENADFYQITLTGSTETDVSALLEKLDKFPNLTLKDKREAPLDPWADCGEDSLRGEYFRKLREKCRQDPNAQLAAEISRKLLEGREVRLP